MVDESGSAVGTEPKDYRVFTADTREGEATIIITTCIEDSWGHKRAEAILVFPDGNLIGKDLSIKGQREDAPAEINQQFLFEEALHQARLELHKRNMQLCGQSVSSVLPEIQRGGMVDLFRASVRGNLTQEIKAKIFCSSRCKELRTALETLQYTCRLEVTEMKFADQ